MAQEGQSQSWWQSLPGVITAIGGMLTALSALVIALHQAGLFGKNEDVAKKETVSPEKPAASVPEIPPRGSDEVGPKNPDVPKTAGNGTPAGVKPETPKPTGAYDPKAVFQALQAANIGTSVGETQLLDWLDDDDRTYRRIADVALEVLAGKRMNGAAPDIDVIKHHYMVLLHLNGDGVLPLGERVNRPLLKQAILMASNEKNGGNLQRFERALANR